METKTNKPNADHQTQQAQAQQLLMVLLGEDAIKFVTSNKNLWEDAGDDANRLKSVNCAALEIGWTVLGEIADLTFGETCQEEAKNVVDGFSGQVEHGLARKFYDLYCRVLREG